MALSPLLDALLGFFAGFRPGSRERCADLIRTSKARRDRGPKASPQVRGPLMLRTMAETRDPPPTRWRRFGKHHLMFTEADTPVPEQIWGPVMVALDDVELKGCLSIVGGDGFARLT